MSSGALRFHPGRAAVHLSSKILRFRLQGSIMKRLTLSEALAAGRLGEFAGQAEADGVGPADRTMFDALVGRITAPQPAGQTYRSRGGGSKRGK